MKASDLASIRNPEISGYPGIQIGAEYVCADCLQEDEAEAAVFPGNFWGSTCDRCGRYVDSGMAAAYRQEDAAAAARSGVPVEFLGAGELKETLEKHLQWLGNPAEGARADLSRTNLRGADLTGADLRGANLTGADLRGADLTGPALRGADLVGADLVGADLRGADLDFSAWPLWCGSVGVVVDERIARQLLAHAFSVAGEFCRPTPRQREFLNEFDRIAGGEFPRFAPAPRKEKFSPEPRVSKSGI